VPVVDQVYRTPERLLQRRRDRAADPVAVQVGQEDASAVAVEEARQGDADRVDPASRARERGQPLEHRGDTFLGSRRLRTALDDPLALEHDELDLRSADVQAKVLARHRAVQPPSTVSTAPVTKGAVAR
jgi:hypothetical protein